MTWHAPILPQGMRRRLGEDAVASRVVLRALARGCGCGEAATKLDLGLADAASAAANGGPDHGSLNGGAASAGLEHMQVAARHASPNLAGSPSSALPFPTLE